jgi:hypothetical protein
VPATAGLECTTCRKFICARNCLTNYVTATLDAPAAAAAIAGLPCPYAGNGCGGHFSTQQLAACLPHELFDLYERAMHDRVEGRVTARLEAQHQQNMQQLVRQMAQAEGAALVRMHRDHIAQSILTLSCGTCGQAYNNFDACFALTCGRCRSGLCAWCGFASRYDAPEHVRGCPRNLNPGGVGGTIVQWEAVLKQRREQGLREYLRQLQPAVQRFVIDACRVDFNDLGINGVALVR